MIVQGFQTGVWCDGSWMPLESLNGSGGMNLNHWVDGVWAEGSWVAESWGDADEPPAQQVVVVSEGAGGDWRDFVTERSQRHLKLEIRTKERQLKKVAKKITNAEKQLVFKPEGILANLHRLETRRTVLIAEIQQLKIELDFPDFEDEDDIEALLLDS